MKKIIVLGAGYGGVLTAKRLAKKLKNCKEVSITIIDKNPYHTMLTQLHEVAGRRVSEDLIKMDLKQIFAHRPVNVVLDTIINFDFKNKLLIGKNGHYDYDYLVIGAGSKAAFFRIDGAKEYSFSLCSYEDTIRLRNHIESQFQKASLEVNDEVRQRMLSFYVIGAGFSGIQTVGELLDYVPILCNQYRISREEVRLINVDILERALPSLSEASSAKVQSHLETSGVEFRFSHSVMEIGQHHIVLKSNYEENVYPTDTIIWTAGIKGSDITQIAGESLILKGRGRLETNCYLQSLSDESVFVVGDNLFFIPEDARIPVPQLVENCKYSSEVVSENIAVLVRGKGELRKYRPKFHGTVVSLGARCAVGELRMAEKTVHVPFCFAALIKHFSNMIYLMQVMGWMKVFDYLKKEFFTIRHRRSVFGGHFSNVTPSFLLLPLRLWLGFTWLFSGFQKISGQWMHKGLLEEFYQYTVWWYQSILSPSFLDSMSSATHTIDARSGATVLKIEGSGEVFWNADFWGIIKGYLVSGKSLADSTFADIALKIDIPAFNNLFLDYIFDSDMAVLWIQRFIVVLEIAVGLGLILGLFNFLSVILSMVLQSMFLITTGLYLNTMWMLFAGVAVLIGGGQTFGIDYYLFPILKKWWKKNRFVKKWYLYHE